MSSMLKVANPLWLAACLLAMATGVAAASTPAAKPAVAKPVAAKPAAVKPMSLQQAVEQAQKDTGGRVLAADTIRSRHGSKYRIKMLTSKGRVRVIEMSSTPPGPKPEAKGANLTNKEKH